ncbi:cell growth regulator with EF hand domain protein 1 [Striga asiatica]|uniref:Cell growth regulator with EF hand domain protein 1 n=1 Tax=Striga asiatica TaxID=4170 RepID=A0A5A7QD78_STRAF|nr:cell growth regulator with EF hand domain protein 1 [Striga asiatica]
MKLEIHSNRGTEKNQRCISQGFLNFIISNYSERLLPPAKFLPLQPLISETGLIFLLNRLPLSLRLTGNGILTPQELYPFKSENQTKKPSSTRDPPKGKEVKKRRTTLKKP